MSLALTEGKSLEMACASFFRRGLGWSTVGVGQMTFGKMKRNLPEKKRALFKSDVAKQKVL